MVCPGAQAGKCRTGEKNFFFTCGCGLHRLLDKKPGSASRQAFASAEIQLLFSHMQMETCAEKIDLVDFRIRHGKCIDKRLIAGRTGRNLKREKDKYQRELCGCVTSCDIGAYNTCGHHCVYCYANVSRKKTEKISCCMIIIRRCCVRLRKLKPERFRRSTG